MEMAEQVTVEPGSAEFAMARLTTRGRLCPHNPKLVSSAKSGVPSCLGFFYQASNIILLLKISCLCKKCYDLAVPDGYNVYCRPSEAAASRDPPSLDSGVQWWQFRPVGLEIYGLSELIRLPLPTSSDYHRALQLFSGQCRPFYMSLFHTMGKFVPKSSTDNDMAITASYGIVYESFRNEFEVGSMACSQKLEVKGGVIKDVRVGGAVNSTQMEVKEGVKKDVRVEVKGGVKKDVRVGGAVSSTQVEVKGGVKKDVRVGGTVSSTQVEVRGGVKKDARVVEAVSSTQVEVRGGVKKEVRVGGAVESTQGKVKGGVKRDAGVGVAVAVDSTQVEVKGGVKNDVRVGGAADSMQVEVRGGVKRDVGVGVAVAVNLTQVEVNLEVSGNVKETGRATRNTSTRRAQSTIQVDSRGTFEAETRKGSSSNGQVSLGAGSTKSNEVSLHILDHDQAYQGRLRQQQVAESKTRSVATINYEGINQQQRIPNRHNGDSSSSSVSVQTSAVELLMLRKDLSQNIHNLDLVSELNIKTKGDKPTAGVVQRASTDLRTLSNTDSRQQSVLLFKENIRGPVHPITSVPSSSARQGTFQAGSTPRNTRGPPAKEDPRSRPEILRQSCETFSGIDNGSTKTPTQFTPRQERSLDNPFARTTSADPRSNRVLVSTSPLAVGGQIPSSKQRQAPVLMTGGRSSDPHQRTRGPPVKPGGLSSSVNERPALKGNFDPGITSRYFGDPANPLRGAGPGHGGNNSGTAPGMNRGINFKTGTTPTYGPSAGGAGLPGQPRVASNAQGGRTLGGMPQLLSEDPGINRDPGLSTFGPSNSKPKGSLPCQPRNGASARGAAAGPNLISKGPNVTRGPGPRDLKPPVPMPKTDLRPQPMNSGRAPGSATGPGRGMPSAGPNPMSGRPKAVPDQRRNDFRPPTSMPKRGPNVQTMNGPQPQRKPLIPKHPMPFQSNPKHMPTMPGVPHAGQHQRGQPPMSTVMHTDPHHKGHHKTANIRGCEVATDRQKSDTDIDKRDKGIGELAGAIEKPVGAFEKDRDKHPGPEPDPEREPEPEPDVTKDPNPERKPEPDITKDPDPEPEPEREPEPEPDITKEPDPDPEPEPSPKPTHDFHPPEHQDKDTTHPIPEPIEQPDPDSNNPERIEHTDPDEHADPVDHPEAHDLEPIEHPDHNDPGTDLTPVEHLDAIDHSEPGASDPDPAEHRDTIEHPDSEDTSLVHPTDNSHSDPSRDMDNGGGERKPGAGQDVDDPTSHGSEPLHHSEDHNGPHNHGKGLALAAALGDLVVSDHLPDDEHTDSQDLPSNERDAPLDDEQPVDNLYDGDNHIQDDYPDPWEDDGAGEVATQDPNEDEPFQAEDGWDGNEAAASLPSDPGEETENGHFADGNENENELPRESDFFDDDDDETHSLPAGAEDEVGDMHLPQELETENVPSAGGFSDPDEAYLLPAEPDDETGDAHSPLENEIETGPFQDNDVSGADDARSLPSEPGDTHSLDEYGDEDEQAQGNDLLVADDTEERAPNDESDSHDPRGFVDEGDRESNPGDEDRNLLFGDPGLNADIHSEGEQDAGGQNSILGDDEHNDMFGDMGLGTEDADAGSEYAQDEGAQNEIPGDEEQNSLYGDVDDTDAGLGQDEGEGDPDDVFKDNDHENDDYFDDAQEEEQGDLDNSFKDNDEENEGQEDPDDLFEDNDEENNDLFDQEEEEHGDPDDLFKDNEENEEQEDSDDLFKDNDEENNDLFEDEHEERQEDLDNVFNDSDNENDGSFNDGEKEEQGDLDDVFSNSEDEEVEPDSLAESEPGSQDDQRSESAGDMFEEEESTPDSEPDEFGEEDGLDDPIESEDQTQFLDSDASGMEDNASEQDDQFDDPIETDDLDGGMEDNGLDSDHEIDDSLATDDFEEDAGDNGIEEDDQFDDPMANEEDDVGMEEDSGENYDDPLANGDFEDDIPDTAEVTYNDHEDSGIDDYGGGDAGYDGGHDGGGDVGYDGGYDGGGDAGYGGGYDGGGDAGYGGGYDGGGDAGYGGGYDG